MTPLIAVLFAYAIALGTTALFVYGIWRIVRTYAIKERLIEFARALGLIRDHGNPILVPRDYPWEAGGVMNPAAVEAGGRVHLFYRAVGDDGVSRIGYASSADGRTFDDRLPYPVFALNGVPDDAASFADHAGLRASGGSYAGVEDPRAVVIDDDVVLSFNAFAGWHSLRIALTSIKVSDLLNKRWKWTPPVYLSAPGEVQKSWVLFPKKVNGRYAVFHGLVYKDRSRAQIAYLDTLDRDPSPYPSSDPRFRNAESYPSQWDSRIRGAATPPIETPQGWLVTYHANDEREPERYKLGAMLLDRDNPEKVLARSPAPILSPDMHYENAGKPGIVYACGAVTRGNDLHVYYGGGDSVVCAAKTSLSTLMRQLQPLDSRYHQVPQSALA